MYTENKDLTTGIDCNQDANLYASYTCQEILRKYSPNRNTRYEIRVVVISYTGFFLEAYVFWRTFTEKIIALNGFITRNITVYAPSSHDKWLYATFNIACILNMAHGFVSFQFYKYITKHTCVEEIDLFILKHPDVKEYFMELFVKRIKKSQPNFIEDSCNEITSLVVEKKVEKRKIHFYTNLFVDKELYNAINSVLFHSTLF